MIPPFQRTTLLTIPPKAGVVQIKGWVDRDASIITSGKTLKLSNDPWAHRGKPFEIERTGDDTRAELVAFIDNARRRDPVTICDVREGLTNAATVLFGNQAMSAGKSIPFPSLT
jgi:hypothetical protein